MSETIIYPDRAGGSGGSGVANSFRPIYLSSGEQATVAALASTAGPTYRLMMYDRVSDRLQLIA